MDMAQSNNLHPGPKIKICLFPLAPTESKKRARVKTFFYQKIAKFFFNFRKKNRVRSVSDPDVIAAFFRSHRDLSIH